MAKQVREFNMLDLTISDISRRLQYRRRTEEEKEGIHWGQRKLLLSEIEFLTIYWDPMTIDNPLCVYAGAAPGTHIPILSMLFPSITFHLYDPRAFGIKATDKIVIYQEYFTEEVAARYANRSDIFFISDIRTASYNNIELEKFAKFGITRFDKVGNPIGDKQLIKDARASAQITNEDQIWGDMSMQQNWVLIMNPEHAFLKFRLPYALDGKDKVVQYLKGAVYWQMWPPQTSTETRLKPVRNESGVYEVENWSILEYEEWCFYHNVIDRERVTYINPFTGAVNPIDAPELLNDYDSTAEAYVLKLFYEKFGSTDIYSDVVTLSRYLTQYITSKQTIKHTLSKLRVSPTRSAGKRAADAYRVKQGLQPQKKESYRHTKVVINPTWRHVPTVRQLPQ